MTDATSSSAVFAGMNGQKMRGQCTLACAKEGESTLRLTPRHRCIHGPTVDDTLISGRKQHPGSNNHSDRGASP